MGRHQFEFVTSSGSSVTVAVEYQCESGAVTFANILTGSVDGRVVSDFDSHQALQEWIEHWADTIDCDEGDS